MSFVLLCGIAIPPITLILTLDHHQRFNKFSYFHVLTRTLIKGRVKDPDTDQFLANKKFLEIVSVAQTYLGMDIIFFLLLLTRLVFYLETQLVSYSKSLELTIDYICPSPQDEGNIGFVKTLLRAEESTRDPERYIHSCSASNPKSI